MVHSEGNQTLASMRFLFRLSTHSHIKEHQRKGYIQRLQFLAPSLPIPQSCSQGSTTINSFSFIFCIYFNSCKEKKLILLFFYLSFLDLSTPIHFSSSHLPYIVTPELRVMSIVSIYIILWLCKYGSHNLTGMLWKCFFSCSFFSLWN